MSTFEFYELLFQLTADVDTQFQAWLTMTFALVVTTFFAGDRLNLTVRIFLTVLYLSACGLVYFRWTLTSVMLVELAESASYDLDTLPSAAFAGALRFFVFVGGTIGACVFALLHHRISVSPRRRPQRNSQSAE